MSNVFKQLSSHQRKSTATQKCDQCNEIFKTTMGEVLDEP